MVQKIKAFHTHESVCGSRGKKTSQSLCRNRSTSTLNKHKRRRTKLKYRGQGR